MSRRAEAFGAEKMSSRERNMLIALGGVLVLALLYKFVLAGGGTEPVAEPTLQPRPRVTATPQPSVTPTPPRQTDESFEGKDPFEPLVTEGIGGVSGDGSPDGTSDGGAASQRVSLLDIFVEDGQRTATVQVDGTQFTVQEGDQFADNYEVVDLTEECGTFVFGDERFTLCIGQEVQK